MTNQPLIIQVKRYDKNNKKYMYLPRDCGLEPGDYVYVIKVPTPKIKQQEVELKQTEETNNAKD